MNSLIKTTIAKGINFIKKYNTSNCRNAGWSKSTTFPKDLPDQSTYDIITNSSKYTTLGSIYHLLSEDDRWMILCCLNYFSCLDKYEKIGHDQEQGKLPFVNLLHTLYCLEAGKATLVLNGDITVDRSKGEELSLQVTAQFLSHDDHIIDPVNIGETMYTGYKEYKEVNVTDTWEQFKSDEQRIKDLIKLLKDHVVL